MMKLFMLIECKEVWINVQNCALEVSVQIDKLSYATLFLSVFGQPDSEVKGIE